MSNRRMAAWEPGLVDVCQLIHAPARPTSQVLLGCPHGSMKDLLDKGHPDVYVPGELVSKRLMVDPGRYPGVLPALASIAREQGRVPAGSKVLFLGTSAGVSLGGAAVVT